MTSLNVPQDKLYAFFGTCLGSIIGYEVIRRVAERQHAPLPVAFFPAAVSPPHLYAVAVAKLFVTRAVGMYSVQQAGFAGGRRVLKSCHSASDGPRVAKVPLRALRGPLWAVLC